MSEAGETILITKEIRTEWMDLMALDAKVSHAAFRIACIIGTHFNNRTGETWLTKEKIAELSGGKERTIWAALNDLEGNGYLVVKRRQIGIAPKTGRAIYGGKGVANTYAPAIQSSLFSASNKDEKLAKIRELKKEARQNRRTKAQSSQDSASKLAKKWPPYSYCSFGTVL